MVSAVFPFKPLAERAGRGAQRLVTATLSLHLLHLLALFAGFGALTRLASTRFA